MSFQHRAAPVSGLRRTMLALVAGAVAGGLPSWRLAAAQGPSAAPAIGAFLALSRLLIPLGRLDARIGARLYTALLAQDHGFAARSLALAEFARARAIANVEALAAAVAAEPALAGTLRQIVSAWYLGQVGNTVVAFDLALMQDQVRDAVVVPTYCNAAPAYWAARPPRA